MCRIAALSASRPVQIRDFMEYFFLPPMPDTYNRDGWGLACYVDNDCLLIKGPEYARESPFLRAVMDRGGLKSYQAVFHVRRATKGTVSFANTHPFVREMWGMSWAFVHHGNVDWPIESLRGPFQPVGETDTERVFCWILDGLWRIFGDRAPPWKDLTVQVWELVRCLWRESKKLNFVLCSPSLLLAFYGGHESMFYCHWVFEGASALLISSTPLLLTSQWAPFRPGELKIVVKGIIQESLWSTSCQRGPLE